MSEGRGRRIALWIAALILLVTIALLAPAAIGPWRYEVEWVHDDEKATVLRFVVDRWRDTVREHDTWSTSTGQRLERSRTLSGLGVCRTLWREDGTVRVQWYAEKGRLVTRESPPWQWGDEDRMLDAPWLGIGFEEWKERVEFREPHLPR